MTYSNKFPFSFKTALVITASVGVWLGIQLAPSISAPSEPAYSQSVTIQQSATHTTADQDAEKLIVTLQQKINFLQSENQRLSLQLQNQSLEKNPQQSDPMASATDIKKLKDQIDALEMEKQQRRAGDVNNWIMSKQKADQQFDLNNELSRRFEEESVDPIWAEKQENHYRQLFSSKDNLRNFALRDTQCRSTQCEVTFSTSSPEQSFQLLQTISSELHGTEILVATDKTQGTSKLYITSQKGFELH